MSISKLRLVLIVLIAMMLAPAQAFAQEEKAEAAADEGAADAAEDDDDDDEDDEDDEDDPCEVDPENCKVLDMGLLAKRPVEAEMYAVQQIWALRARRVELNLYGNVSMNDQFVGHPGPGVGANYYINNELAVGLNANIYAGMNSVSDFNFETSRAARIGMPITEYQWNANLNVSYVPAYGKFAAFKSFIFHYDFYLTAGGGVISTRPIAVVDPDNRTFDFKIKPTFGAGGGVRIFFTRYLAAMLEIRDYIYFEELENPTVLSGFNDQGQPIAQDEATWLADGTTLTNNVQAQLGISVFLPFTWQYRLPK